MAFIPDIRKVFYSSRVESGMQWNSGVSGKDWGIDPQAGLTRKTWQISLPDIEQTDFQIIRDFWLTYHGTTFYFFEFDHRELWSGVAALELGTGVLDIFTIPAKETTGLVVYIDDVEKELDVDYSLLPGTGDNEEDRIQFEAGHEPGDGSVVSFDFAGRLRYEVRFDPSTDLSTQYRKGISFTLIQVL